MKGKRIRASERQQFTEIIAESQLLLPFYDRHSVARSTLLKKMKQDQGQVFGLYENHYIKAFVTIENDTVTNLLIGTNNNFSWKKLLTAIENICKATAKKQLRFHFVYPLEPTLKAVFLRSGYIVEGNTLATKVLIYHTALVLGGGGARGSYQIGVWQALKELEIPIKIITGTSVGALNGALILQDDFEVARNMWEKIETQQILSFSGTAASTDTLSGMVSQIGSFTLSAIQSKGISTKPLNKLIKETFSEEKMQRGTADLYVVATELPNLQEKVVHFNACQDGRWADWLLASASFFPAMAAAKIDNRYYIDGGYRNNVPTDIALRCGATECIIVDVKGPGLSKPIKVSETIHTLFLQTPWPMGTVLLFDGTRSLQNIHLGYLETMKAFGKYQGFWYTFSVTDSQIKELQRRFFHYLTERYDLRKTVTAKRWQKICAKLGKYYKATVYFETISLVLLELLAKNSELSAVRIYTIDDILLLLQEEWHTESKINRSIGMISVQEWVKKYYEEYFLLSEKQQLQGITNLLNINETEKKQRILFLLDKLPAQLLQILMKEFILKGVHE